MHVNLSYTHMVLQIAPPLGIHLPRWGKGHSWCRRCEDAWPIECLWMWIVEEGISDFISFIIHIKWRPCQHLECRIQREDVDDSVEECEACGAEEERMTSPNPPSIYCCVHWRPFDSQLDFNTPWNIQALPPRDEGANNGIWNHDTQPKQIASQSTKQQSEKHTTINPLHRRLKLPEHRHHCHNLNSITN